MLIAPTRSVSEGSRSSEVLLDIKKITQLSSLLTLRVGVGNVHPPLTGGKQATSSVVFSIALSVA